ncbi:TIGR03032 family protein [Singulisphaera sp. Ch08]|uniref:TIGR03032 family protein n=1 Tax=Singulisphaera sp. Ch08 TaxID=3120278 RepID=A0AAU7CAI4_9BACT
MTSSPSSSGAVSGLGQPAPAVLEPLRAGHTDGFPELLRTLGVSLLVTTYQAGKLVVVREQDGRLNTHFRNFPMPMGLAVSPWADRLAIGTKLQVCEFRDVPEVAAQVEPEGTHDACFLPRSSHVTGDVAIHEMAYGLGGELWFVNTRFSCLATIDPDASFVPRWRPPFVSELEPTDRCHLNGLAMEGGAPRFVTALGRSDAPAGWRTNKARGGVLIDVTSGEIVVPGLSMPHSPRLHGGHLWACESGAGTLGVVDPAAGKYEAVASVPGFTRGLDFAGHYAFVGLSQVRESAVFSGIPITEHLAEHERICGIAVIDVITGQVVGLLRFEDAVQEIFAVAVLPRRFPELMNEDETLLASSFVIPTQSLPDVAESVRAKPSVPA